MNAQEVEDRLIEAMTVFSRGNAFGASPWATDGPWREAVDSNVECWLRELHDLDLAARRLSGAIFNPRPDRAMVDRAEAAAAWLLIVAERDRKLVVLAVGCLARGGVHAGRGGGERGVPWSRLLKPLGMVRGAGGLARRYGLALEAIAKVARRDALIAGRR